MRICIPDVGPCSHIRRPMQKRPSRQKRKGHNRGIIEAMLLNALKQATLAHPLDRKLLVCRTSAQGRELLRALVVQGTPWIGWQVTTLRMLAHELAAEDLARRGLTLIDEFTSMRLVDEAIEEVAAAGNATVSLAARQPGFRDSLQRALRVLREVDAEPDTSHGDLVTAAVEVKRAYERRLRERGYADRATVLRAGIDALSGHRAGLPGEFVYIVPMTAHHAEAALLRAIVGRPNTHVLESDAVMGLPRPQHGVGYHGEGADHLTSFLHAPLDAPAVVNAATDVTVYAAATPHDEVREALRRAVARNIPWDQIEIVATDARVYGAAVYATCQRLGIPLTMSTGLDLSRTRVGRAVHGYLRWVRDSYPSEAMRVMLESGDVAPRDPPGISGARLAQRLRRLRIGWGRDRYERVIEKALRASLELPAPDDRREPHEAEPSRTREQNELRALRELFRDILGAAPDAPPRLNAADARGTPSDIANGLLAFLRHVPPGDEADQLIRERLEERLRRARSELTAETSWDAALARIGRVVRMDVAVPTGDDTRSWTSQAGRLHFSDVTSGGYTGRPYTFILGLDAMRVGISAFDDPILTDDVRRQMRERGVHISLGTELHAERRYEIAALTARLRGRISFSFAAWDAADGRAVPPASEMLQALRLIRRDESLSYSDLHAHLGRLASAVPAGDGLLDAGDVWLNALVTPEGVMRDAGESVLRAYASLARGLAADRVRDDTEFTAYQGRITRKGAEPVRVFSATQLEALGTCPRRFFYRYLLRIEPPDIYDFDPEVWLDPLERGSLLHKAYELTLDGARVRDIDFADPAFATFAHDVLEETVRKWRDRVPPPGEAAYARERGLLHEDFDIFIGSIREQRPEWLHLEYEFGRQQPFEIETTDGPIRLRGAIDRIDRLPDGKLRVIDYKTGSKGGYFKRWPFAGGRRIQHVVYAVAATRLLGDGVADMEYHFPTRKGQNGRVQYPTHMLQTPENALGRLLRVAQGNFFPATDDANDCRWCDFRDVCRVKMVWGRPLSKPSEWTYRMWTHDDFHPFREIRNADG